MCEIDQSMNNGDLSLTCKKSGKPITVTNQYGMFCEDMCDLEECKKGEQYLKQMISQMTSMFENRNG